MAGKTQTTPQWLLDDLAAIAEYCLEEGDEEGAEVVERIMAQDDEGAGGQLMLVH